MFTIKQMRLFVNNRISFAKIACLYLGSYFLFEQLRKIVRGDFCFVTASYCICQRIGNCNTETLLDRLFFSPQLPQNCIMKLYGFSLNSRITMVSHCIARLWKYTLSLYHRGLVNAFYLITINDTIQFKLADSRFILFTVVSFAFSNWVYMYIYIYFYYNISITRFSLLLLLLLLRFQ